MTLYMEGVVNQPGPPENVYPDQNSIKGLILHGADGYWSEVYGPLDTMRQRGVSWHFSIHTDGRIEQHYPVTASCWHGGSKRANTELVGVEFEGTGMLTEAQIASGKAVIKWVALQGGWRPQRAPGLARTLHEHNEWFRTACPDGRIPWARFEEDEMETIPVVNAEFMAFYKRLAQEGVTVGKVVGKPGEYLVKISEA